VIIILVFPLPYYATLSDEASRRAGCGQSARPVRERVRDFLARRHKMRARGTRRFSSSIVYGERGVLRLERLPWSLAPCASRWSQSESRMRAIRTSGSDATLQGADRAVSCLA